MPCFSGEEHEAETMHQATDKLKLIASAGRLLLHLQQDAFSFFQSACQRPSCQQKKPPCFALRDLQWAKCLYCHSCHHASSFRSRRQSKHKGIMCSREINTFQELARPPHAPSARLLYNWFASTVFHRMITNCYCTSIIARFPKTNICNSNRSNDDGALQQKKTNIKTKFAEIVDFVHCVQDFRLIRR